MTIIVVSEFNITFGIFFDFKNTDRDIFVSFTTGHLF